MGDRRILEGNMKIEETMAEMRGSLLVTERQSAQIEDQLKKLHSMFAANNLIRPTRLSKAMSEEVHTTFLDVLQVPAARGSLLCELQLRSHAAISACAKASNVALKAFGSREARQGKQMQSRQLAAQPQPQVQIPQPTNRKQQK
eukprot:TRINITY_DN1283_c0_g1_i4.p1 TRINITY_DN1283_c0_g1~~TRINITY_DN1283_c0_g1_i4.p1  ORF type:complete len:157 (+),score=42.97 TRINITY_DN1283_c0_g1_i4:41-472(+)